MDYTHTYAGKSHELCYDPEHHEGINLIQSSLAVPERVYMLTPKMLEFAKNALEITGVDRIVLDKNGVITIHLTPVPNKLDFLDMEGYSRLVDAFHKLEAGAAASNPVDF